ncbi:MAG: RepB family protein [Polyangiaceae bacterium]
MVEREKVLNVRISAKERAQLERLCEELGVTQSVLVRQWIRTEYENRFGLQPPPRKARA